MKKRTKKRLYLFLVIGFVFLFSGCSRNFCSSADRENMRIVYRNKTAIYLSDLVWEENKTMSVTEVVDHLQSKSFTDTLSSENISYAILRADFKSDVEGYAGKLNNDDYKTIYENTNLIELMSDKSGSMKIVAEAVNELYDKNKNSLSCMTINDSDVEINSGASISKKTWGYAFSLGPLEGLFIFPISSLMILITNGIGSSGIGQLLAIIFTTFIIRLLVLALTFKSTMQSQKMTAIQPEIQAINNKYQGANDQASRQRMSQEIMKVYSKHGVNPLSAMVAPFLTMPIFVAVYHAVSQTAVLKAGKIFGLTLGTLVNEAVLTDGNAFAIILFILMIITQFVTMKLPQFINKRKAAKSKRYVDPKTLKTQGSMNVITYVFLIMIVVMGWMMPAAMTVYWIASSMVSITQTLVINYITNRKKEGK